MVTPRYTTTCTRKKLVAPNVYEVAFTKPKGFSYKPGQFILFDVPLVSDPADIQPRAYSLASTDEEHELLFIIKLKKGGRFSEWLEHVLTVGMSAVFQGPFGLFLVRPTKHDRIFIGTGAGVAPFRAQLRGCIQNNDSSPLHLFFGVRNEEDLFWTHEWKAMESGSPNVKIHLCLSGKAPKDWYGKTGRVQEHVPAVIRDPLTTDIYICGAPEMVADIKALALGKWGIPKANVHAEGYI